MQISDLHIHTFTDISIAYWRKWLCLGKISICIYFDNSHGDLLLSTVHTKSPLWLQTFIVFLFLDYEKMYWYRCRYCHTPKTLIIVMDLKDMLLPITGIRVMSWAHMYLYKCKIYLHVPNCTLGFSNVQRHKQRPLLCLIIYAPSGALTLCWLYHQTLSLLCCSQGQGHRQGGRVEEKNVAWRRTGRMRSVAW